MKTLREMVGVNVHMSYTNTVYASSASVRAKLIDLGLVHVRDFYVPNMPVQWTALSSLTGIGKLMGIGAEWIGNVPAAIAGIKANVTNVEALEGVNEYDLSGDVDWRNVAKAHNDTIRGAVVKDPALIGVMPVAASSIVFGVGSAVDDYLINSDVGNRHPYPGGAWETTAHLVAEQVNQRRLTGYLPPWATEWGYHTATGGYIAAGHPAVTETQQRDRMIAGLFTLQGLGWERVYIYELLDQGVPTGGMEKSFGLYRNAGTPKPAAAALKLWMGWVGDLLPATVSHGFTYTQGAGINVREFNNALPGQTGDGSHLVAIWREAEATARNIDFFMNDNAYHWAFNTRRASTGAAGQRSVTNQRSYTVTNVGTEPTMLYIKRSS